MPNTTRYTNSIEITQQDVDSFRTLGFVKLPQLFTDDACAYMRTRIETELDNAPKNFQKEFKGLKYDFESSRDELYELMGGASFRDTLSSFAGRSLFLTFEMCFQLERNVSKGFPWHVGVQSFGYQRAQDFACTMWVPLDPIDASGQRGGMQYVPRTAVSAEFMYEYVEPALADSLRTRAKRGETITLDDYFALREGVLNSPAMLDILGPLAVEDSFQPGDAFLFDKYVIHRSVKLGDGPLGKRDAFVMRFVDTQSRYDRQRALNIDFPVQQFGYKPYTRSHMEVGRNDGDVLAESAYFDHKAERTVYNADSAHRFA